MLGRIAVEQGGYLAHSILGRGHLHVGHAVGTVVGQVLTKHGLGAQLQGFGDELVAVGLRALHGNKQMAVLNLA